MSVDIDKILKKAKELNAKKKNKPQCNSVITGLPAEYKPWYQGDNFSPEEAEKLETSQPPIMEVLVTTAVEDNLEVTNLKTIFKEDNFMDNDRKTAETQPSTNLVQTEYKPSTNLVQTEYKPSTNLVQTEYKPSAQPSTTFKTEYKPSTTFSSLVGLQRKLVKFVYDECKIARAKTTKQLSIEYIVTTLETPYFSIKATIQRLIKKGVVIRTGLKQGRGGWVTYGVPDLVFNEILRYEETEYKPSTNLVHCSNFEQKPSTQPSTSLSSSSSYINNKNTTTQTESLDYSGLAGIGFTEDHLTQILREYEKRPEVALSSEQIQNSIYALAFDLKHNDTSKLRSPIGVLISGLKNGKPYCSITPDKFKTPREEALQNFTTMVEQQQKRESELENNIKQMEFDKWKVELTDKELCEFCPMDAIQGGLSEKHRQTLQKKKALEIAKEFFEINLWPSLRKTLP